MPEDGNDDDDNGSNHRKAGMSGKECARSMEEGIAFSLINAEAWFAARDAPNDCLNQQNTEAASITNAGDMGRACSARLALLNAGKFGSLDGRRRGTKKFGTLSALKLSKQRTKQHREAEERTEQAERDERKGRRNPAHTHHYAAACIRDAGLRENESLGDPDDGLQAKTEACCATRLSAESVSVQAEQGNRFVMAWC